MSYRDEFPLIIESFCGLVEHFLTKAKGLYNDLIFGLELVIDLVNIKDNLTNI
jgi:hypothetical protein